MTGRDVAIQSADGAAFAAYLAKPANTPAPGIVVLQEIFGVNPFVRTVVDHFAEAGFVALAPDLFWRQSPGVMLDAATEADRERAMQLFKGLDERKAVEDSIAAMRYLRSDPALCTGRVGAVGYCLGGKLAYLMAARSGVNVAVGYYGVGIHDALGEAVNIKAPLLLHIAGADHLCSPEKQAEIAKALAPMANIVRIETHPGAGHAFARSGGPTFQSDAAAKADAASVAFLNANLL